MVSFPSHEYVVDRRVRASEPHRRPGPTAYSAEEVVDAVRRWATRHGEPPTTLDWDPARARRVGQAWRAERNAEEVWPTTRMVRRLFGSFNAAVEAAGLRPREAAWRQRPNFSGPDAITDAIVAWVKRYGALPTMADWDPARARRLGQDWRIARYYQGDWPSARSAIARFGSFAAAIEAAGMLPRLPGARRADVEQVAVNRRAAAVAAMRSEEPGLAALSDALRALARARQDRDPVSLHAALLEVAGAALGWAELCASG